MSDHELGFCIPDENWKCIDCGADVPQPELPSNFNPNLGNIVAISHLIDATREEFNKIIIANTDPKHPKLPRLRMVGGQLMRLENKMIVKAMVGPSYLKAQSLGYLGTQNRWFEMIFDDIPTITSYTSPPTSIPLCGIIE